MKKWFSRALAALLGLLAMVTAASAEPSVVNLIDNPDAPYAFAEGAPILEIVFPRVYSSDCAILRMEGMTMMVDASTESDVMQGRIRTAMDAMGVEEIAIAYNSHPHRDHINGFEVVQQRVPIDEFVYCFPEDYDWRMRGAIAFIRENGVPTRRVFDGDVIALGESGLVTITVIKREGGGDRPDNCKSSMLMIEYGERRFLLTGDNENRSQKDYAANPPACGRDADILKYPHHGGAAINLEFFALVSPELCFTNAAANIADISAAYLAKQGVPCLYDYKGLTRMRTDGKIWVVDYLREPGADRALPYTAAP